MYADDRHKNKRKRRAPPHPSTRPPPMQKTTSRSASTVLDIHPSLSPTTFVPSASLRDQLRRQAQDWRGVTAIEPWPPPLISLHPLLPEHAPSMRPPSYAAHTTQQNSSSPPRLPYWLPTFPTPSNTYGLGIPKLFVRLTVPPLNLALDPQIAGFKAQFVRSGSRPSIALRTFLLASPSDPTANEDCHDKDLTTLTFCRIRLARPQGA